MLRALYTAGTAMIAQSRRMDVVSNNMANVETAGFKSDNLLTRSFRDMLIERQNDPSVVNSTYVGPHNTGIRIDEVSTSFAEGRLENTGNSTDLAIAGDGFFVVGTPGGAERYTRSGAFQVDSLGRLSTGDGNLVMGINNQPLYLGTSDFQVDGAGNATVDGMYMGTIRVVSFANNADLRKDGANLYNNDYNPAGNAMTPSGAGILQGTLEGSNVDAASETVKMIEIYRSYEINQRIARIIDESLTKAVSEIARF